MNRIKAVDMMEGFVWVDVKQEDRDNIRGHLQELKDWRDSFRKEDYYLERKSKLFFINRKYRKVLDLSIIRGVCPEGLSVISYITDKVYIFIDYTDETVNLFKLERFIREDRVLMGLEMKLLFDNFRSGV